MDTRVLVVEDDPEINELLGEYLSLEGIGYSKALTGGEGIQQVHQNRPQAVILDLMLPDIDGFEVCRQIASRRCSYDVPVILLTCMNQETDRFKGIASGAFRYMNKPFLPDDLLASLKDALEHQRQMAHRPPQDQFTFYSNDPLAGLHAINQMINNLFVNTQLADPCVGQIRDAFVQICEWLATWGQQKGQLAQIQIAYRLMGPEHPVEPGEAATHLEWEFCEPQPGPLAETILATQTPVKEPGKCPESSTMGPWFAWLGKLGAQYYHRDPTGQCLILRRSLGGMEQSVPVVHVNGTRIPTRVREEAAPARKPPRFFLF